MRVFFFEENAPWFLKGGYSLELQFENSRSTKDIDLVLKEFGIKYDQFDSSSIPDPIHFALTKACENETDDFFKFLIKRDLKELTACPYEGARYLIEAEVAGKRFVTFHVDISINDLTRETDYQLLDTNDWLAFANIESPKVKSITIEQIFAEKLHAYTTPRQERPNSRTRDLVDMVLLISKSNIDPLKLKTSLKSVFGRRKGHPMPNYLSEPPESWETKFPLIAEKSGLDPDLGKAYRILEEFLIENDIVKKSSAGTRI